MARSSPEARLSRFIDRYSDEVADLARAALTRLREILGPCTELVYDNYNALVVGFGPTERASDAVFSIALYPRWVTLFFLQGASLPDPTQILQGKGTVVRHIVLESAKDLDNPAVRKLMKAALRERPVQCDERRLVIKSVSAKQRPRRPGR